jgi:class 3 adenylate cyclase/CHASE2 domain-containing sensor protein
LPAFLITFLVWLFISLAMRPMRDADGSFAARPYGLTTAIENQAIDLLFQLRDVRHPERRMRGLQEPITIIGIDEESVRAAGLRAQNYPRSNYARLIDRAGDGGASVIGLDLLLVGNSGSNPADQAQDQTLVDSIKRAGNVVLAEKTAGGGTPALEPATMFAYAAWARGFVDLPLDSDGLLRSAAIRLNNDDSEEPELSFAAHLLEGHRYSQLFEKHFAELKAKGAADDQAETEATTIAEQEAVLKQTPDGNLLCGNRVLPLRNDGFLQLDFRARPTAFRYLSAAQVLAGDSLGDSEFFRNRIVLIAQTSVAGADYFATPFFEPSLPARLLDRGLPHTPARTSGIEIHATAIATMLNGDSPWRPRYSRQIVFLFLPLLLAAVAVFSLRAWLAVLVVGLIGLALLLVASSAFNSNALVLPLATSWLSLVIITPAGLSLRYARERAWRDETAREKAQMMEIFSRCVSPQVAEELWQKRDALSLAGERRVVTIIFTDIRNFTTLSEGSSSEVVVEWLTEYFSRMNKVVIEHGGHISKFIGDGLMIVFGAPVGRTPTEEARAAVRCGMAMLEEVERINAAWRNSGRPEIHIGVGIHTGEATCGVVGSELRMEYTVIGDTVNLAARLESKTKDLRRSLVMSEATANFLNGDYDLVPLGMIEVKGKTLKVNAFAIGSNDGQKA